MCILIKMPVFALIIHISCCLNWLIVYLEGNLLPKICSSQLRIFWRLLVASSGTSYCYRSLHQHVGTFFMTFCCTALKKQLYVCEQAYNLVFVRVQKKFYLLQLCQSQKRAQFIPECPEHCKLLPLSHFLSSLCEILKLGRNHGSCVIAAGSPVLCIEGAWEQWKPSLKMHHLSGWELISADSLALRLERSASDFVKYFLRNHRGCDFSVMTLKSRRERAKTKLSKDASPVSSSSSHTKEHCQVWEQGSHHPAGFSWRFFHAIRRNYLVFLCLTERTHTHKICGQLKIKGTYFTWLTASVCHWNPML